MIHSGLVAFHDDLGQLLQPIDSIEPHPANYNNGDVEAVAESIEVNGMYRPLYVQTSTGYIIAGNHTWAAAKMLGATEIPVLYLHVDDEQAYRIMIADNRIASLAVPDNAALVRLLDQLATTEVGLHGTGVDERDLAALTALTQMQPAYDEFGTWPTLTFTIHPRIRAAFMRLTCEADTDPERLELLMRLAGWDGQ